MKISFNWLQRYIDVELTVEALTEALPMLGFEIEEVYESGPPPLDKVVVGEVVQFDRHPNADRLRVCEVGIGGTGAPLHIVCGADNFQVGDRVPVALPGAVLPDGMKIKKSKLRGEPSEGMLCSAVELRMGQDQSGIHIFAPDTAVGTPINDLYPETDTVFDLEVTPNRVDALCHLGIAREVAARFGGNLQYPEVHASSQVPLGEDEEPLLREVRITAPEACPHYTAMCVKGVRVAPSPPWLRTAIEAIGLRPVNNVVDVTNYVLHETCQPLHAFDAAKIQGDVLYVRNAAEGETMQTLDEKERRLESDMAVIADAGRALVVAGVMGSQDAEVDESTTDIVLESAYFNPSSVRSTSRRLGLSTDSSYRFERGTDAAGVEYASLRAVDLIQAVAGGEVSGSMLIEGHLPETESVIEMTPQTVRDQLGFEVPDAAIREILESLELSVAQHDKPDGGIYWEVAIPSFRGDLQRPVDLVEEFIRVYGTDKIPDTRVLARGMGSEDDPIHAFNESIAADFTGRGFDEAYHYSLRDGEETEALFGTGTASILTLANPLQSDQSHLRPSLVPGLLDTLRLNLARGTGATRFFERGRAFAEVGGELRELVSVGFVLLAESVERRWRRREPADFFTARTISENLLHAAGAAVPSENFRPIGESVLWQEGHSAAAGDLVRDAYSCETGMLDLKTVKERWDVSQPVLAGSVLLDPGHFRKPAERPRYSAVGSYPGTTKDLAFIVDEGTLAGTVRADLVEAVAASVKDFTCEAVDVFDVYKGKGLPEGKKSLAFGMVFRASDRTLTDEEVNQAFERMQAIMADEKGYALRKGG